MKKVVTLIKSIQSFPLERDLKFLTKEFHNDATETATLRDLSCDKWKHDEEIFSTLYPNLQQDPYN